MAIETILDYRIAQEDDFPAVAQLWLEMFEAVGNYAQSDFRSDWRSQFIAYASRQTARNEMRYFVAEQDGEIVGSAGALVSDGFPSVIHGVRNGYIFGVSVRPNARNRGIATTLTQQCIAWLREIGVRRIRLHASLYGRPMYEKLGFVPTNEMQLPR